MRYCQNCGYPIADDAKYCPHCGASIHDEHKKDRANQFLNIVSIVYAVLLLVLFAGLWIFGRSFYKTDSPRLSAVMSQVSNVMSILHYVPYVYYGLFVASGMMIVFYFLRAASHPKEKFQFLFIGCYSAICIGYWMINDIVDLIKQLTNIYNAFNGGISDVFNFNGFDNLERLMGTINSDLPTYETAIIIIGIAAIVLLVSAIIQRLQMAGVIKWHFFKTESKN